MNNLYFIAIIPDEKREFSASFAAKRITLLRHNGKDWDIYQEFTFQSR